MRVRKWQMTREPKKKNGLTFEATMQMKLSQSVVHLELWFFFFFGRVPFWLVMKGQHLYFFSFFELILETKWLVIFRPFPTFPVAATTITFDVGLPIHLHVVVAHCVNDWYVRCPPETVRNFLRTFSLLFVSSHLQTFIIFLIEIHDVDFLQL